MNIDDRPTSLCEKFQTAISLQPVIRSTFCLVIGYGIQGHVTYDVTLLRPAHILENFKWPSLEPVVQFTHVGTPRVGFSGSANPLALLPVWSNPRWCPAAMLEIFKWPYFSNGSSRDRGLGFWAGRSPYYVLAGPAIACGRRFGDPRIGLGTVKDIGIEIRLVMGLAVEINCIFGYGGPKLCVINDPCLRRSLSMGDRSRLWLGFSVYVDNVHWVYSCNLKYFLLCQRVHYWWYTTNRLLNDDRAGDSLC